MGAERESRAEADTQTMLAEMLLPEIRKHSGLTQKEVADILGITQSSLSKIENQDDMQIGTLKKLIVAIEGQARNHCTPSTRRLPIDSIQRLALATPTIPSPHENAKSSIHWEMRVLDA